MKIKKYICVTEKDGLFRWVEDGKRRQKACDGHETAQDIEDALNQCEDVPAIDQPNVNVWLSQRKSTKSVSYKLEWKIDDKRCFFSLGSCPLEYAEKMQRIQIAICNPEKIVISEEKLEEEIQQLEKLLQEKEQQLHALRRSKMSVSEQLGQNRIDFWNQVAQKQKEELEQWGDEIEEMLEEDW